jgi:hypothetical protein
MVYDHPNYAGPIGVTGSAAANAVAEDADVVIAVGTRLQDFTTGSWSVFQNPDVRFVSINTARWDATKQQAKPVIGDAQVALGEIDAGLGDYRADPAWLAHAQQQIAEWHAYLDGWKDRTDVSPPAYATVIQEINQLCDPEDYCFDSEYGYSTMGYEIAGAWGAKMARGDGDVIAWVGDGSYLIMNSDVYSTVFTGHKVILMVMDNGGFAVINRLQVNTGGEEFNNLLSTARHSEYFQVDFVNLRPGQGGRPHLRHRHGRPPVHLDRGRRLVGGGHPRGQRSRAGAGRPCRARRREEAPASRGVSAGDVASDMAVDAASPRRFAGKVGLVTGSTQGVGEAVARRLAADGAAGIVVTGRNRDRGEAVAVDLADDDAEALFVPAELSDADACRSLVATADERFGRLDMLVNAADIADRGSIVDTTPELFDAMFAVNVRAPLLLMQGAIELMRREGIAGSIVNVGSVAASGSVPILTAYAASKAADPSPCPA